MKLFNKEPGAFPSAAIRISFALAAVIFIIASIMMNHQPLVRSKLAGMAAFCGNYELAREFISDIDAEKEAAYYNAGMYNMALAMMNREDYDLALDCFSGLGDYSDSKQKCILCQQKKAGKLISQGKYLAAADILKDVIAFEGSKELYEECQYHIALDKIEKGDWLIGVKLLWSIRDYRDAGSLAEKTARENSGETDLQKILNSEDAIDSSIMRDYIVLKDNRKLLKNGFIAVGFYHTVGLRQNGTVVACGHNQYGQCDTGEWKHATAVAAGAYHTLALLSDGTVVACGDNTYGQCDVTQWKNVVQITASDYNSAALLSDGTVVTCGFNQWPQTEGWTNMDSIFGGAYSLCGITMNGELKTTHPSFGLEEKLADIGASTAYSIGLTYAGDVIYSSETPCEWKKAIAVYAGGESVAIIDRNYKPSVYQRRKALYDDLPEGRAVSIALGGTHFAVLYDDGSVYCAGLNDDGQCNTSGWNLN